jgi:hypothetical protein
MAYRYVPEKDEPEYSERIKDIIKAHEDVSMEWIPNEKDTETLKEIAYLKFSKKSPQTAKQELLSVYREKDEFSNDEWMLWKVKYSCLDKDDRPFEAEVWLGKKPKLDTEPIKDAEGNTINKTIRRWNMVYTQPWDPKKLAEIMKEFKSNSTKFYLSSISDDYWQNFGGTSVMIKDKNLFKTESYDALMSYDEGLKTKNIQKEAIKKMTS